MKTTSAFFTVQSWEILTDIIKNELIRRNVRIIFVSLCEKGLIGNSGWNREGVRKKTDNTHKWKITENK